LQIESYDLFLDVDFRKLRFDGKVKIRLESETDVKLNSVELEILEVDANGRPVKHKAPETLKGVEAGIEKLRINQAFLKRIGSSEKQMVEVQEHR